MQFTPDTSEITYPPILWKFPPLCLVIYWWNYLLYPRNFYVLWQAIMQLRARPQCTVLDVGAGEGQHIITLALFFKRAHLIGVDIRESSNALRARIGHRLKLSQLSSQFLNIERDSYPKAAHMLLCTGVLQYIPNDISALKNMYESTHTGGKIVMWVPVANRTILPFFKKWHLGKNNYEKIAQRQRIYSKKELAQKLSASGFKNIKLQSKMGFFGIVAYELITAVHLVALRSPNLISTIFLSVLIFPVLPISTVLYILDAVGLRLGYCNAKLIIAIK